MLDAKIDIPTALRTANEAMKPVDGAWLAGRLKALWKSSTPTSAMSAVEWLNETGRLTKHYPFDIIQHAIDEAVRNSPKGFTPTAGAIITFAEPLFQERTVQRDRLDLLVNGPRAKRRYPWEPEPEKPIVRCTPEQAAAVIVETGLDKVELERKTGFGIDTRKCRMPTEGELADLAAEFNGGRAA